MKVITVHKISLEDYNKLREAGYSIRFHLPEPKPKVYTSGKRLHTEPYKAPEQKVRAKVETSIRTPYASKYPKKRLFE